MFKVDKNHIQFFPLHMLTHNYKINQNNFFLPEILKLSPAEIENMV